MVIGKHDVSADSLHCCRNTVYSPRKAFALVFNYW